MIKSEKPRVIFDTNIWISFLIGKQLSSLQKHLTKGTVSIIITEQLLVEIQLVTRRKKLRKYFPKETIEEFVLLLRSIAENFDVEPKHFECRDQKDNFLLDLIDNSQADYLVTGDKDLLELKTFLSAKIVSPSEFEILVSKP